MKTRRDADLNRRLALARDLAITEITIPNLENNNRIGTLACLLGFWPFEFVVESLPFSGRYQGGLPGGWQVMKRELGE